MKTAERLPIFQCTEELRQTFDYRLQLDDPCEHSPKLLLNRRKKKPAKPLASPLEKLRHEQFDGDFSPKDRRQSRVFQDLLNSGKKKVVNLKELPKPAPAPTVAQLAEAETPTLACGRERPKQERLLGKAKRLMALLRIQEPAEERGLDEQGQACILLDLIIDAVQQSLSKLHQPDLPSTAAVESRPGLSADVPECARRPAPDLLQSPSDSSIQDFDLYLSQFRSRVASAHTARHEAGSAPGA